MQPTYIMALSPTTITTADLFVCVYLEGDALRPNGAEDVIAEAKEFNIKATLINEGRPGDNGGWPEFRFTGEFSDMQAFYKEWYCGGDLSGHEELEFHLI